MLAVLAGAALWLALALVLGWLSPSLDRDEMRSAVVTRGLIEETLDASGVVVPARETIVTSPADTRIVRVLRRVGDRVSAGDALVQLDSMKSALESSRVYERLQQKRAERERERLALEQSLSLTRSEIEQKKLEVEIAHYKAEQARKLTSEGLASNETLRQAEVQSKKADIELAHLERSLISSSRGALAALQGLDLEISILSREADESRRQLQLAEMRADRDGVITSIIQRDGVSVSPGEEVARIADLASFRVEATMSDVNVRRIAAGMPVYVMADAVRINGRVSRVDPTIERGAAKFWIDLDEPSNTALRSNLRVDVYVVAGSRKESTIVRKGAFFRGIGEQDIFVVRGRHAERRRASFGVIGSDTVEILSGAAPGETIITSETSEIAHLDKVRIR